MKSKILEFKRRDKINYFMEIKDIENRYFNLVSSFNVNFPKPINLESEKKKFFEALADDKIYNPFINYEKKVFDLKKFEDLKNFKISTRDDLYGFKKLYKQRLKSKIDEIYCHINWGKALSTKFVVKYRGKPSKILLSYAKIFCKNYKREKVKFKTLTHNQVSKRLKDEVFRLTKKQIDVLFVQIPSKVNILPNHNLLKINPYAKLTSLDVKRLKVHEIGVHYMRYFNALNQDIKILESGTSNYIETEEGLAVYCEYLKGVSSKAQMFIYAGRVIATYYCLKKSFYEIFKILKSYGFEDEEAFMITFRSKRNICDTSKSGGFTKDYVYFSGFLKVKKFHKNHDLKDLFIGKIKIEDRRILRKYIKEHKDSIVTIFDKENLV